MANFVYTYAKRDLLTQAIILDYNTIKVALVMANTTAGTEEDAEHLDDFTTLDEMDGANYARQTITTPVVAADNANDRGEFDGDDVSWNALGSGTRQVQAAILLYDTGNDATSVPIAYYDTAGFPFDPAGSYVSLAWSAEGILQAT